MEGLTVQWPNHHFAVLHQQLQELVMCTALYATFEISTLSADFTFSTWTTSNRQQGLLLCSDNFFCIINRIRSPSHKVSPPADSSFCWT
jgi:hypothetical protein